MALTKEEAQRALREIQAGLIRDAEMYKDIPQCHIKFAKNQKSSSANAEERGEKRGKSDNPLTD